MNHSSLAVRGILGTLIASTALVLSAGACGDNNPATPTTTTSSSGGGGAGGMTTGGGGTTTSTGGTTTSTGGGTTTSTGGGGSGGMGTGGAGGTMLPACTGKPGASSQCDAPEPCGYPVDLVASPTNPPAMTGGTIPDGTYLLTKYVKHTGPGGKSGSLGATVEEVIVIENNGTTVRGVLVLNGKTYDHAGTFDTSGGKITVDNSCPQQSKDSDPDPYTYKDDTLTFLAGEKDDEQLFMVRTAP